MKGAEGQDDGLHDRVTRREGGRLSPVAESREYCRWFGDRIAGIFKLELEVWYSSSLMYYFMVLFIKCERQTMAIRDG